MLFDLIKNAIPKEYRDEFKVSVNGKPSDRVDGPHQEWYLEQEPEPILELFVEDRLALFNSIRAISAALDGKAVHVDFRSTWRWGLPFDAATRGSYHIMYVITLCPDKSKNPILWSGSSQVAQDFVALPFVTRAELGDLPLDLFGYCADIGMPHVFHGYSWTPKGLKVFCESKGQCAKVPLVFKEATCSDGEKEGHDWVVEVTFPKLLAGLPTEYQIV